MVVKGQKRQNVCCYRLLPFLAFVLVFVVCCDGVVATVVIVVAIVDVDTAVVVVVAVIADVLAVVVVVVIACSIVLSKTALAVSVYVWAELWSPTEPAHSPAT